MIKKMFHDRLFIVTTFPVAVLAFWLVQMTFWGGGFLPLMLLLLLSLLTAAEYFVAFEIRRTNKYLNAEIEQPVRPWYSTPFWSWDGAKQRLTSSKAWFAIAYVFAAIFFSGIGVTILVFFWLSIGVLIFAFGVITPSNWSWIINLNEQDVTGKLSFLADPEKVQFTFNGTQSIDSTIPNQMTWAYTSGWTIAVCVLFILLNIFVIPVLAKHMKDVATNLLGANALPDSFVATLQLRLASRKK
jgi:hypothetical protein